MATSTEARNFIDSMRNRFRSADNSLKWPSKLNRSNLKKILIEHNSILSTAEIKDGYAMIYMPGDMVIYASSSLKDLNFLKPLYTEFKELTTMTPLQAVEAMNIIVPSLLAEPGLDLMIHAAAAGLYGYAAQQMELTNNMYLNMHITRNNETAALIAASNNQKILELFLIDGFKPLQLTQNSQNIGHYAAKHPEMLQMLKDKYDGATLVQIFGQADYKLFTPVHVALGRPSTLKWFADHMPELFSVNYMCPLAGALIDMEADTQHVNNVISILARYDPEFAGRSFVDGSCILHCNLKAERAITVYRHASLKSLNTPSTKNSKYPIHSVIQNGCIDSVFHLCASGADPNVRDSKNITPLFYAIRNENIDMIKTLLLFGAEIDEELWKAVGVLNNDEVKLALITGANDYHLTETREFIPDENRMDHILLKRAIDNKRGCFNGISFDGGGMKGLVSLQILREIQMRYEGKDLMQSFRTLTGTSTGSIIVLSLSRTKNVDKTFTTFLTLKDAIFTKPRPYCGDRLEAVFNKEMEGRTMNQLGRETGLRLSIAATRVDVSPPILTVFRSYQLPSKIKDPRFLDLPDWSAAKVARCSTAAPSYFPPVDGKYMDGGIIANNPTLEVLCDEQTINVIQPEGSMKMNMLISVGTGVEPVKSCENVSFELANAQGKTELGNLVNTFTSVLHMKDICVDQLTSSDGINVDRARMMAAAMGIAFFRFSPPLSRNYALDDTSAKTLIDMMWDTKVYMQSQVNEINAIIQILETMEPEA